MKLAHQIGKQYLGIGNANTVPSSYDIASLLPLQIIHVQRVNTMLSEGIYSGSMFDILFEHVKKPLVMLYVDEELKRNFKQ